MTVSNITPDFTEISDGVTADYAFTFKLAEAADLKLYYDGVLQVSGYTVTINDGEGGNVNLSPVPAASTVIYSKRVTPPTQPLEIPRGQPFDEAKTEEMIDRVTMLVQESLRVASLSLRIPDGETNTTTASDAATRANKVLAYDADGDLIESTLTLAQLEEQPALALAAQIAATTAAATATTKASEADASATSANLSKLAAEAAAAGMKWRPSVRAATTTTLPACTYANGTSGVGATLTGNANGALAAQDGVTLAAGEYLLVKDQASALQNGVYGVTQVGTAGTPFILTRLTDADTWAELVGQVRIVEEGSTNADTIFICTVNSGGAVGTNNVTWSSISVTVPDGTITYVKLASSAIGSAADLIAGTASKLVNAAEFKTANRILQIVTASTNTADSSTTILPLDGTIPQNTEGKQLLTATIVPKNASSTLRIEVCIPLGSNSGNGWAGALFRDSTANALAACGGPISNTVPGGITLVHYVAAGSTASTDFKFRYGPSQGAGTAYVNSLGGTTFGGVQGPATMTITEIAP